MRFVNPACLLLLISALVSSEAKDTPPKKAKAPVKAPTKKEKVPDYSKGFALFHKLGVPDVSKMEYIKIDAGSHYDSQNMTGNAWLIKDNGDDGAIALMYNNTKVTFYNPQKIRKRKTAELKEIKKKFKGDNKKLMKAMCQLDLKYDKIKSADYSKADLKKDITEVKKQIAELEKMDEFNSGPYNQDLGRQFIFAIHINDKGYKNDANIIVGKLFKINGKRETIVSAVNQLANDFYGGIYRDFTDTRDWENYSLQLDSLIKKMPDAWSRKPVIKLLAARVKERISGKIPQLNSNELSPENLKIADELVDAKKLNRRQFWLLPESKKAKFNIITPAGDKVFEKIFANGVESIPLLVALLKDNYLTDLTTDYNDYNYKELSGQEMRRMMNQDRDKPSPEKVYREFTMRPLSRGDIARVLLSFVLIEQNRSFVDDEESDDTAFRALELYKVLKGKKPEEVAEYYLKNGEEYSQKPAAVKYLCDTNDPKYIAMLEKYFLDNAGMNSRYEVMQYLETRGPEAKEFVQKYLKALKGGLEKQVKNEGHYVDNKKELIALRKRYEREYEEFEKSLQKYMSSETAEQVLMKIAAKDKPDNIDYEVLRFKVRNTPFEKIVPMLLKAAVAAKSPETKYRMLWLITMFQYNYDDDGERSIKHFKDFKATKSLWLKLIDDKTLLPGSVDYTIGKFSMNLIERLSPEVFSDKQNEELSLLPEIRSMALIKKRALARLDGKSSDKLPSPPDVSKVSGAEYKKLIAELKNIPAPQAAEKIKELPDDMFIKLAVEMDKNQDLNKKLLFVANKITKVDNKIKDKDVLKQIPEIKGTLSEGMVRKLFDKLRSIKLKDQYVYCLINANTGLEGVTVYLSLKNKMSRGLNNSPRFLQEDRRHYFSGTVRTYKSYANCLWPVKKTEDAKKAKESSDEDDLFAEAEQDLDNDMKDEFANKQKAFWEGVRKLVNRANAMRRGDIYLTYN